MPILPVAEGSELDPRWLPILMRSNIDGIVGRNLIPQSEVDKYSEIYADATQPLLRQLVELAERPKVQTCRGIALDNPWYLSYLGVFGDLPEVADGDSNRRNGLRIDLTFADVADIESVGLEPSAAGLVTALCDWNRTTAVELTRTRLTSGMSGGYNKGFPSSSRFSWGGSADRAKYGPNILVVYEPGSVDDLALLWNLRARFTHPRKFPLAIPLLDSTPADIQFFADDHGAHHFFGLGHDIAITSFSVSLDTLRSLVAGTHFDVVEPWNLLGEIHGYCVSSTEIAHFSDGEATVASFSPTEAESLGQSYLGSSHGTWLKLTTIVSGRRLPPSPTMRLDKYQNPGYLYGRLSSGGKLSGFTKIQQPTGQEVLSALAADRGLEVRFSAPGKSAEHLVRAADGQLSMFASPGITAVLTRLTRRGHASLVKRRLNQYLAGHGVDESADRIQILTEKLDRAIGSADLEEVGYMNFDRLRTFSGLSASAAARWIEWAVGSRVILQGVESKCPSCGHKQWRPLADVVPHLTCHGCGRRIDNPFGHQKIDYQYRASETLLRAMSNDVLPAILAMRHVADVLGWRDGAIFGIYPGIELLEEGSTVVSAEIDVVAVLGNGKWIVGECKTNARGLSEPDLLKLWAAADRVNAPATFVATLDRSANCDDPWKATTDPNGRPHFALTAEHLYDLRGIGPAYGDDFFAWRDNYPFLGTDNTTDVEQHLQKQFADYLLRTGGDPRKRSRAPWDRTL